MAVVSVVMDGVSDDRPPDLRRAQAPRWTRASCGAGGFWSKIFDVQGQRFSRVTCTRCRYTEFYHADTSMLGNIFDLFTN